VALVGNARNGFVIQLERVPAGPTHRVSTGSEHEMAALRRQFEAGHHVLVPNLFGPGLLAWVQQQVEAAKLQVRSEEIAGELTLPTGALVSRMRFLLNDPLLYGAVEAATGVRPLVRFQGRIYRKLAAPEHFARWHDDLQGPVRLLAMSVNLSQEPYEGGVTEIRYKGSTDLIAAIQNNGPGDALIFRIDPALEHRVTGVTGGVKTAIVGWFGSAPPWPEPLANGASAG
jgi:hypothetical protein